MTKNEYDRAVNIVREWRLRGRKTEDPEHKLILVQTSEVVQACFIRFLFEDGKFNKIYLDQSDNFVTPELFIKDCKT